MKQGGIGVGSASIVLVFAVLCLTVFTLITFVVSGNDKALADAEAELVVGYYEADALAEQIFADIAEMDDLPDTIRGVEIGEGFSNELFTNTVYYLCPITEGKSLYVELADQGGYYDVLSWRMVDTEDWEYDDSLHVWLGDDNLDVWLQVD
ncbi:MAG: hypothetical protein FWH33_03430 [Oscillospiraceae bacterium]|nr:hypothetical protein [Oscillospiraceae bacterium]